ncbi:hypothetical protein DEU56DRAFT_762464 [Suillus clintonianus]|uniref:uncharacterized protein n=1 Tax=Suillus clintonianus TaxID=1904413 RepID=UPI001B87CFA4|nr:uncharacterized protein DEU56DRAFT_762464 [Suillus clintonianus]KAG2109213.1 hypothetical protein DEU56DRAFT_762464 [Suillus clintonianus]
MEGKRDEVLECKRAAREANKGTSSSSRAPPKPAAATGKPGGLRYDTGGRAYLLDSETRQAIYIATDQAPDPTPEPESREFAGLASDTMTPTFIRKLSAVDDHEYTALLAAVEPLQTSLDWRQCSRAVDFAGLTYKAPNQRNKTIVDPSIILFFLDSGASVHISNCETDFFHLRPIPPRVVNSFHPFVPLIVVSRHSMLPIAGSRPAVEHACCLAS